MARMSLGLGFPELGLLAYMVVVSALVTFGLS